MNPHKSQTHSGGVYMKDRPKLTERSVWKLGPDLDHGPILRVNLYEREKKRACIAGGSINCYKNTGELFASVL